MREWIDICRPKDIRLAHAKTTDMIKMLARDSLGSTLPEAFKRRQEDQHFAVKCRQMMFQYSRCLAIERLGGVGSEIWRQLEDPYFLPTRREVLEPLGCEDLGLEEPAEEWAPASWERLCNAQKNAIEKVMDVHDGDIAGDMTLSFQALTGSHPTPLLGLCLTHQWDEVLTVELVDKVAEYIKQRAEEVKGFDGPVVEVAAGNGRLAYFLNGRLPEELLVRPSDNDSWLRGRGVSFGVETIDHAVLVERDQPSLVLCQWMPNEVDFTAEWRQKSKRLREYILLGAADDGNSGKPWETFGLDIAADKPTGALAPFAEDGFEKIYLDKEISKWQIQGNDNLEMGFNSRATAFRKGRLT